jgi:hypothetical protein
MLLQLVRRITRPCIAFHAVPNAPPASSKQCERLRASSAPNACVYAYGLECRMERQGSTANSMIGVVQVILHVASVVLFPSDVFVFCAAGVHTLLRCHMSVVQNIHQRSQLRMASQV